MYINVMHNAGLLNIIYSNRGSAYISAYAWRRMRFYYANYTPVINHLWRAIQSCTSCIARAWLGVTGRAECI